MRECLGVSYFRKTPHLISLIGSEYVFYLTRSFQIQSAAIVIVLHAVVYVSGEFLKEMLIFTYRSSQLEVLCRKGVFRNFAKFTGKQSPESLVPEPRPATLLKKRLWHTCFPLNLAKFLRIFFLQNTSGGCFCTYKFVKGKVKLELVVIMHRMIKTKTFVDCKIF